MRVGYARVDKATDRVRTAPADRGVIAFYGRAPPPAEIWLDARVRADLRWIDDEYSNRWRLRLEATREFTARERAVVPNFNVAWSYDARYDGRTRTLYQVGTEVTVNTQFRFEVYLARQNDRLPKDESLAALALNAKWYYRAACCLGRSRHRCDGPERRRCRAHE
jgi:hypothetical protein